MADILKVTPAELVDTAAKFKTYQNTLKVAYLTMSDAVRHLDASWNGEASETFKAQFDAMYANLSQTEEKMDDAIDELTKAHDLYEDVEAAVKAQADALETGTSPF